jgi:hypothetical protein
MVTDLAATFEVTSWDEVPFDDQANVPKMTRAVVAKEYAGDINGDSVTEWLMAYANDGSATFVGLERIVGQVDDRAGTLVLQHVGSYADGSADARLAVVEGAGSGELGGARGSGTFQANPGGSITLTLTFD